MTPTGIFAPNFLSMLSGSHYLGQEGLFVARSPLYINVGWGIKAIGPWICLVRLDPAGASGGGRAVPWLGLAQPKPLPARFCSAASALERWRGE